MFDRRNYIQEYGLVYNAKLIITMMFLCCSSTSSRKFRTSFTPQGTKYETSFRGTIAALSLSCRKYEMIKEVIRIINNLLAGNRVRKVLPNLL